MLLPGSPLHLLLHALVNNKLMSLGGVDAYALLLYFAAIHTMTPHATETEAEAEAEPAGE